MKIIIFFALAALAGYIIGYLLGRFTAEQEIQERRSELGIDEEPEDAWDELFKERYNDT